MLYCRWRHKVVIKAFLYNTQYCYVVASDTYFNNKERNVVSTVITVTRTRRNVTRNALPVMR